MSGIDPEWAAFAAGLKPSIRVTVEPKSATFLHERFTKQGARVVVGPTLKIDGRSATLLYIARSEADALALRDVEARALPGSCGNDLATEVRTHMEMGRRLGFPRCCVEAFCARIERGVGRLAAEDYVFAREAWVPRPNALVNNLLFSARRCLVSFYPCRYDCAMAGRYAAAVLDVIRRKQPAAADVLNTALSRAIVIAPDNTRALVILQGDKIVDAQPPRDPVGGLVDPHDEPFALALTREHPQVEVDGRVRTSDADLPPWLLRFDAS